MPLVNMTDMLQHAYRHGYAVGAFGVASWDMLEGVVKAAETLRAPRVSRTSVKPPVDEPTSIATAPPTSQPK